MIGIIYDGSFEGLLTCIYEVYYRKENPSFIWSKKVYIEKTEGTLFSLLEPPLYINTDMDKYNKVYNAILNKISQDSLETIYNVYLSEVNDFEMLILSFVKFGFKTGFDTNKHMQDDRVLTMLKTEQKVLFEAHRMLGFIRFERYVDFYYAEFEPDNNITAIVTPHFVSRMPDERFIIHDIKRETASIYDKYNWYITSLTKDEISKFIINKNNCYEDLWKSYFKSASISERKNERNQKRQMPKRYWKHLPEI